MDELYHRRDGPRADCPIPPATLWSGGYGVFLANMGAVTLAVQIQGTVVGYQLYELTGDPLALGLAGLAEAIPFISLVLFGGHVADRLDRRRISLVALAVMAAAVLALHLVARQAGALGRELVMTGVFSLIVAGGICRSFLQPARVALAAQLVPRPLYARAVAWRTGVFQVCAVTGPAVGGLLYASLGAEGGYAASAGLLVLAWLAMWRLRPPPRALPPPRTALWTSLGEGIRYLRGDRILGAAIVLDLFAVLFGGAVALLPVFANEVLAVGARGFGLLRAAPAAGAVLASALLALRAPMRHAGLTLLAAVAGFGLCMIGFALSRWFVLSLVLLAASGALDMVSVLVRSTLLQLRVPENMMGRVAAINQVFIGSSNEIGAFESGLAARLLGTVPSVVLGGSITVAVAAVAAWRAPELRRLGPLVADEPLPPPPVTRSGAAGS